MDRLRRLSCRRRLALLLLFVSGGCGELPRSDGPDALSPAASWLQRYLQLDTTGAPGNATVAVDLLADLLAASGAHIEILDDGDGQPSLWAYLPPSARSEATRPDAAAETLLLLHHLDVVGADDEWLHPPFSGALVDGELWGRGAIDAKSLGIAHLASFVGLAHSGAPRRRGVALLAAADEEKGGQLGVGHWLDARPELFSDLAAVINEGGINRGHDGRLHWWGIEIAQKRPLWLEVRGEIEPLIAGLARLTARDYTWRVPAEARFVFERMAPHYNERWRKLFVDLERFVRPGGPTVMLLPGMESFFLDSIQTNLLEVTDRNDARARIDARLLPDTDQAAFLTEIKDLLGPLLETEVLLSAPPVAPSPWEGPWIDVLHQELRSVAPIVPQMAAGTTDSRYFRQRGIAAYGFSPFILNGEYTRTVHARNERIPVAEFDHGVERMTALVAAWAAGNGDGTTDGDSPQSAAAPSTEGSAGAASGSTL